MRNLNRGVVFLLVSMLSGGTGLVTNGCAPTADEQVGSAASFVVSGVAAEVARIVVTATPTGPGRTYTVDLVRVGDTWRGTISRMAVGTYSFSAVATNAMGMVLYSGAAGAPVNVTSGATASVVLNLELAMSRRPSPFMNAAPVITALSATASEVTPGAAVSLTATATDPDGDALTYLWSATGGTFSTTTALTTVWTAPATESNYDLTLVVSDARGASSSVRYRVRVTSSSARGNAEIQVVLMSPPDITNFTLSSPDATGTSTLAVTAVDPDGDAMTYNWSSSCDGYFNGNMALSRAWPMAMSPMTTFTQTTAGACTLSVVVRDVNGNQNTATITRGASAAPNTAPEVEPLFQSVMTVASGETVVVRAAATDPEGAAVSLVWSANAGTVSAARDLTMPGGARTEEVTWTAPACFPPGATATITVRATDAAGAVSQQTFTVTSSTPDAC